MIRVVAVGLLRPPPSGVAWQVDADTAEEVPALGPDLPPDRLADSLFELDVPGRAAGHGDGKGGALTGHAATRSVREPRARDTEPIDGTVDNRTQVIALGDERSDSRPELQVAVEEP